MSERKRFTQDQIGAVRAFLADGKKTAFEIGSYARDIVAKEAIRVNALMNNNPQATRESAHPLVIPASTLIGFESSQIQAILDGINPVTNRDSIDDSFTNPNIQGSHPQAI